MHHIYIYTIINYLHYYYIIFLFKFPVIFLPLTIFFLLDYRLTMETREEADRMYQKYYPLKTIAYMYICKNISLCLTSSNIYQ